MFVRYKTCLWQYKVNDLWKRVFDNRLELNMDTLKKSPRPKHLDLMRIRLPITGVVSILHRASGILLLLAIPYLIYLMDLSLSNSAGFDQASAILNHPVGAILSILLCWALAHHFFAGIRFLLFDIDIGVSKISARRMAVAVLLAEVVTVLIVVGVMI